MIEQYADCFAGHNWCSILVTTYGRDHKGKPTCAGCPFFKTRSELAHARIAALYRLASLGLLDAAVEKYGPDVLKI